MKNLVSIFCALIAFCANAQEDSLRVLFIGNSYVYSNNLPTVLANCASSTGRYVESASSTPGGHTLQQHVSNATTRNLIMQGNWDFVVLQEQSQIPSFPDGQVALDCFPYAAMLNDTILKYNPCAETVFYMTWGRQNGDSQNCAGWPPVCTYEGMDDLLRERYMTMAFDNEAIVSPAGAAWREWRTQYPDVNLYSGDGSHPSVTGTYLIACTFYAALFRDNPENITNLGGIDEATANNIQTLVKQVVYDNLSQWYVGNYDVQASFTAQADASGLISIANTSSNTETQQWYVNGQAVEGELTSYQATSSGTYTIALSAWNACGQTDSLAMDVQVTIDNAGVGKTADSTTRFFFNEGWNISSQEVIQELKLYNVQGQLVWQMSPKSKYCQIPPHVNTKGSIVHVFTAKGTAQKVLGQ